MDWMNKEAALAFGRVIVKEYESWACEKTGHTIEVSREQALALLMQGDGK